MLIGTCPATAQSANLAPWFGPHLQRNVYLSLLHMGPEEGQEKATKIPESVIRAALLRRAVEDIRRLVQIRSAKAALSSLLQKGSVGDDLWQRFLRAEKEMENELRDVVMEVSETSALKTQLWPVCIHFLLVSNLTALRHSRPMRLCRTGANRFSNPPMRLLSTLRCESA